MIHTERSLWHDLTRDFFLQGFWEHWPIFIPFLLFAGLFVLWILYGRDKKLRYDHVEFAPPEDITPARALILEKQADEDALLSPRPLSRLMAATLLELHFDKAIALRLVDGKLVGIQKRETPSGYYSSQKSFERKFLEMLFASKTEIEEQDFRQKPFQSELQKILGEEARNIRREIQTPESFRVSRFINWSGFLYRLLREFFILVVAANAAWILFVWVLPAAAAVLTHVSLKGHLPDDLVGILTGGVLFALLILPIAATFKKRRGPILKIYIPFINSLIYATALLSRLLWLPVLFFWCSYAFLLRFECVGSVILSLLTLMFFSHIMPRWTASARAELGRLLGFYEFIRKVDADRIKRVSIENPEAFRRTLPWAILSGQGNRWLRAMTAIGVESENLSLLRAVYHFFDAVADTYRDLITDYWATKS